MLNALGLICLDKISDTATRFNHCSGVEFFPYGGRPLIAETIRYLTQLGVKHFIVLHDPRVKRKALMNLRKTSRWGTSMEFAAYTPNKEKFEFKTLHELDKYSEILIARGDIVRNNALEDPKHFQNGNTISLGAREARVVTQLPPFRGLNAAVENLLTKQTETDAKQYDLSRPVRYLNQLYDANMQLNFKYLIDNDIYFERALGVCAKPGARLNLKTVISGEAALGSNSVIHHTAKLLGKNLIGDNVYVDRNAKLENSIVFDGSYIGVGTVFSNCIINRNTIYRMDEGCINIIYDRSIVGRNEIKPPDFSLKTIKKIIDGFRIC